MFTNTERRMLSDPYFTIIQEHDDFVYLKSKNTRHCWVIQKLDTAANTCPVVIHHKHREKDEYYHKHGKAYTVGKALQSIKNHDEYVLNTRRSRYKH